MHSSDAWKLALALVLGSAILFSLFARAPRSSMAADQLRRLMFSALLLYSVGAFAWVTGHRLLAAVVCASGTGVAALAAWLSRGSTPDDPPSAPEDPVDPEPPASPDGAPEFDWAAFERGFRSYSDRERELTV